MDLLPVGNGEFSVEIREAPPAHLLFKVHSFSKLSNREIQKHESRAFAVGNYKWRLILYPKNEADHISLFLSVDEIDTLPVGWEVNASCSILLHNQISNRYFCFRGKEQRFDAKNSKWGFSISKRTLIQPSNGYLVDDSCAFGAEVLINQTPATECLYLLDCRISHFSKLQDVWNSPEFVAGGLRWKIKVFPKGNASKAGTKSVSIYLECVDSENFESNEKAEADFCIRMKNKLSPAHVSKHTSHCFTFEENDWGYTNFIEIADFLDPSKGFIVEDCCFLEAEISVKDVSYTPKQKELK